MHARAHVCVCVFWSVMSIIVHVSLDQLASLHSAPLRYLVPLSLDDVEYNETPMGISRLMYHQQQLHSFTVLNVR